ncbi:MAG: putative Fe-S cluster assembly protein SufT [Deltaproteobacteria bacterium]|nr:putative Fe-S cluster assembly protein SufT [Deltaproteobacteria bacterium]
MTILETVLLTRDCQAIQIPNGEKQNLPAELSVGIIQSLGGFFTILTEWGEMYRIDYENADALGKEKPAQKTKRIPSNRAEIEQDVLEALKNCYDPEIPIDIVELGLVYGCGIKQDGQGYRVTIQFTLTAPGCGMGDLLKKDIESKIISIPGVTSVYAELVLDPPWDRAMMSDAAKLQLGIL